MDTVPDIVDAVLYFLALLSVLSWAIFFAKLFRFRQNERSNRDFLASFSQAGDVRSLEAILASAAGSLAGLSRAGLEEVRSLESILLAGIDWQDRREMLQQTLQQQMQREQASLESGLAVLASVGSTAPFIGLFGTVWGIMGALKNISLSGSARLDVVAGPIGEALIATAMGIAVAVPAVVAYNYFLRRLRLAMVDMDRFSAAFIRWCITTGVARS